MNLGCCYDENMKKRQFVVNSTAAVGYLLVMFGWLWAVALLLTGTDLLDNLSTYQEGNRSSPAPTISLPEFSLPEPITMASLGLVTILMLAVSIYVLVKTPSSIVKQSSRITNKAATKLTPLTTRQHQPIPTKKRRILTARLSLYLKLALALIPLLVVLGLALLAADDIMLAPHLALLIASSISCLAIGLFGLQYLLAGILKLPLDKLL